MAIATQVKDADEPDDDSEVNIPDDLTEALDFARRHLAATPAATQSRPPA